MHVFVRPCSPGIRRPPRELKGFSKVLVKAGQTQSVKIEIPVKYATAYWDEIRESWIVEAGSYDIEVCDGMGRQESLMSNVEIEETVWWNGI